MRISTLNVIDTSSLFDDYAEEKTPVLRDVNAESATSLLIYEIARKRKTGEQVLELWKKKGDPRPYFGSYEDVARYVPKPLFRYIFVELEGSKYILWGIWESVGQLCFLASPIIQRRQDARFITVERLSHRLKA